MPLEKTVFIYVFYICICVYVHVHHVLLKTCKGASANLKKKKLKTFLVLIPSIDNLNVQIYK